MPRLFPRLAHITQAQLDSNKLSPFDIAKHRPRRPKSLHKPTLPNPSFDPNSYPQSILLQSENPVATPDKYFRHKTLPPRVYVPKDARQREGEHDRPRQMTEEERKWWSSPYRMSYFTCFTQSQSENITQSACLPLHLEIALFQDVFFLQVSFPTCAVTPSHYDHASLPSQIGSRACRRQ